MSADSASVQFSAAYGSTMVRPPSVRHKQKIENLSLENMVEVPIERIDEFRWEDFWHLETTETVAGHEIIEKGHGRNHAFSPVLPDLPHGQYIP